MSEQTGKGWLLTVRIVGATFAACSAPVGFAVFAILFHNYFAGVANAIVGIIGAFNLHLHLTFKHNRLAEKYSAKSLKVLKWAAIVLGLLGLVAAFTFFCLAAIEKIPVLPIQTSMILPGIQSLLVVQECATHFFCRRKYLNLLSETDRANLVEEVEATDNEDSVNDNGSVVSVVDVV